MRPSCPKFFALARRLHAEDRFFAARRALLSGPYPVVGRWAAPRVAVSPEAVPYRPAQGVHVVVGPALDASRFVDQHGVAGAWQFCDAEHDRTITVSFVDGDLWQAAADLGTGGGEVPEWAGPLERVDAFRWDWFATLTPQ